MVPRPFLMGGVRKGRGRKDLVNNSTPMVDPWNFIDEP